MEHSLSCITYSVEQASFLCLGEYHTPFWVWSSFQHFILCTFNVMTASESSFNVKFFACVSPSGPSLSPLWPRPSLMWLSLPSAGCICGISWMAAVSAFSKSALLSVITSAPYLNFISSVILFYLLHFHLFGLISTFRYHFCKMSGEFITRRQGGNATAYFAVCVWTEWQVCSKLWKTWCDWSLTMMRMCYLCSVCGLTNSQWSVYNYSW